MDITAEFGTTTVMMCLFFGTNALLFALFYIIKANTVSPATDIDTSKKKSKELSKPFIGTTDCFANLTRELFRTSLIMAMTYICEKHWIFEHSGKEYSRDLFIFVLIVFFAVAFATIKPVHDLSLLGREQTEEWKGWMQFIFLLYHYFHAEEVYNAVRCMITCYVWMTGFGNFSFFYMKRDFGWLRVVQMLWRLNFSVLLLMWTHGNTYILYYICPLHTFYFLMVYAVMYVYSSINHSKWAIRFKLLVLGIIIFIIWDVNGGLFDTIFYFLGTDSVIGAKSGSVWEWYFRTSLDHWSTYLGMIFALNYPVAEQYFAKARGGPLAVASIILGAMTIWWGLTHYTQEKMEYNLSHSYFAIIPLLSYIFFRNITPYVRSGVSMSLHELGKTTLETYLLQHHIWLTSNAKTLLTLVPGHPWINFALASILFYFSSRELYRLTMSLRGMVLPDDKQISYQNSIACVVLFAVLYGLAFSIQSVGYSAFDLLLAIFTLFLVSVLLINRFARSTSETQSFQTYSKCGCLIIGLLLIAGVGVQVFSSSSANDKSSRVSRLVQLVLPSRSSDSSSASLLTVEPLPIPSSPASKSVSAAISLLASALSPSCAQALSVGHWISSDCSSDAPKNAALCKTNKWVWDSNACPIGMLNDQKLHDLFVRKNVALYGDSMIRNVYHQLNGLLDSKYTHDLTTPQLKHVDQSYFVANYNISVDYFWTPTVANISSSLASTTKKKKYDLIVIGAAAWDALYTRSLKKYTEQLETLAKSNVLKSTGASVCWLNPTTIIDGRLNTPDKQTYMTEKVLASYREAVSASSLAKQTSFIINPATVSAGREGGSPDGIHYGEEVYQVIAQMISNGYGLSINGGSSFAAPKPASKPPPRTGSMSMPHYGLTVLLFSFIMLFTLDSFLGAGALSLFLFGKSYDWDAAYIPLLNKLGIRTPGSERLSELSEGYGSGGSSGQRDTEPLLGSSRQSQIDGETVIV